ncbi:1,4-alpha-glucan branching protein GlgB [Clostridium sp. DL1XJH146]
MIEKKIELSSFNKHSFHEGTNFKSYEFMGSHVDVVDGIKGVKFAVWAPNAIEVRVVGDFNNWDGTNFKMECNEEIWTIFVEEVLDGAAYMYQIFSSEDISVLKADPYAFSSQLRPKNASVVKKIEGFIWTDLEWRKNKEQIDIINSPINIYEVHLGSWKQHNDGSFFTYKETADELVQYVSEMGYTHIELMPIMEHPLDDSWGYQITGYYSVTARYGKPKDFMYLVNKCHENGIGVILDWVPGHFCKDEHGLYKFDNTHLFENDNPLVAENYDWGTANFDFKKKEISTFLISNAVFWFELYHIDGIRVDAVANMLHLNYGKKFDTTVRNEFGGVENLEAVEFLKKLNQVLFEYFKNPLVIAEDSSTWPLLTKPTYVGGVGFSYKWNMGWMNDMLEYMSQDPVHRKWYHDLITFSIMYTWSENFLLPLSHDEVVHGKKSLIDKMPGDYWRKFANLRVFYAYMMGHPGKKLLFMGGEFGQFIEWDFKKELDWFLTNYPNHKKMQDYVKELNILYRKHSALWEVDHSYEGFNWIDHSNIDQSIVSFKRIGKNKNNYLIFICNFTPEVHYDYSVGVSEKICYKEIFNTDREKYGGSNQIIGETLYANKEKCNNEPYSIKIKVPPLACVVLKPYYKPIKQSKKIKIRGSI